MCGVAFRAVEGGLAPGEAIECPHEPAAIRRAEGMARNEAMPQASDELRQKARVILNRRGG
jgi:hypothetical protein